MKKAPISILIVVIVAFIQLLVIACASTSIFSPSKNSEQNTVVVQTVNARLTQSVFETVVAQLTDVSGPDDAGQPRVDTAIPSQEQQALTAAPQSPTPEPSSIETQFPTATFTVTATSQPCEKASFVEHVTIPEDAEVYSGAIFKKTWRLKNTGSCEWTPEFQLKYIEGERMDAPDTKILDNTVKPGEMVDISIYLVAPQEAGSYSGQWKLTNTEGKEFGVGEDDRTFITKIKVIETLSGWDDEKPRDFVHNSCSASWRSAEGILNCPGAGVDFDIGSITRMVGPTLEGGYQDDEAAIIMVPNDGSGGYITGHYPEIEIRDKDHFRALVGCLHNSPDCYVMVLLNYRIDDGQIQNLGSWSEHYDENYTYIDVDLSSLAGKSVEFVLSVQNNGSSKDDRIYWLAPEIVRVSP